MRSIINHFLQNLMVAAVVGCATVFPSASAFPERIQVWAPNLYPEGVSFDERSGMFFLSSVREGRIVRVHQDGRTETFANDPRLVSTLGLALDRRNNRLWACVSDPGVGQRSLPQTRGQLAQVAVIDLDAGKIQQVIDLGALLPGPHLANDLALDNHGNVYVTDSFAPMVYKIDSSGVASVLAKDQRFSAPAGVFGLNGIVYHPDGYLLAAHYASGTLYRISLSEPSRIEAVAVAGRPFSTADGLALLDSRTLAVTSNHLAPSAVFPSAVWRLSSENGWRSAHVNGRFLTGETFPTTLAEAGDRLFVVNSYISHLFSGNSTIISNFSLQTVRFESMTAI